MEAIPQLLRAVCVFGLTLEDALKLPEAVGAREVDVVELWCGVGSIVAAASAATYVVRKFDKFRVPEVTDQEGPASEDLLSSWGFLSAVRCVLAIRTGGLLWMAPVCSSFVFMNSSKCKRKVGNWMGDMNYKPVAEGNLHATVAAFLYALAHLRGVLPVIENPAGSVIFHYPMLELVLSCWSGAKAICCRCAFATERMGKRWKKAYKLVGDAWVTHLAAPCRCPSGLHCSLVHRVLRNGAYKTTGRKDLLRASAAYPTKMGKFVVQQWMRHSSGSAMFSKQWKRPQALADAIGPLSTARPTWQELPMQAPGRSHNTCRAPSTWKTPSLKPPSAASRAPTSSSAWKKPFLEAPSTASSASSTSERQAEAWKMPFLDTALPGPAWKQPDF